MTDKPVIAADSSRRGQANSNEFSIDLLAIVNRRKFLLAFSCLAGLLAGLGYFLLLPPTYESTARILLMQNDSATMASQMQPAQGGVSEDLLATHMGLLQSKRIVGSALKTAGLE